MVLVRGKNGKVWGSLNLRERRYETTRNSEHFCFKHKGYGIQKTIFPMLKMYDIVEVRIKTKTALYVSPLVAWVERGITDTLRSEDGEQIFLPVEYMIEVRQR